MSVISTTEARNIFTKAIIAVYKERVRPTSFLRSFFPTEESLTRYVSIEVERGTELVAVDVLRGSEGNRNTFGRSTEKVMQPPYYREYFDLTELDIYDRLFGSASIEASVFAEFTEEVVSRLQRLVDKIERAYELQAASVLQTGIVALANGSNIDFKRKAASMVNKSSEAWSGANNPFSHLEAGGNFIRQEGKSQSGILNAIMGSSAYAAFLENASVKGRADIKNISLDAIHTPQKNSVGGVLHGEVSAGSYSVRIWTYPEIYETTSGNKVPYIDPKNVIIIPEQPKFKTGFAAVPQLLDDNSPTFKRGAYVFGDYKDHRNSAHIYDVKSAGITVPVAVDQIYTMQVLS